VFVDGSPRRITLDHARAIIAALPAFVEPVACSWMRRWPKSARPATSWDFARSSCRAETHDYVAALAPLRVIKSIGFHAADGQQPWRPAAALRRRGATVRRPAAAPWRRRRAAGRQRKDLRLGESAAMKSSANSPPAALILAGGLTLQTSAARSPAPTLRGDVSAASNQAVASRT